MQRRHANVGRKYRIERCITFAMAVAALACNHPENIPWLTPVITLDVDTIRLLPGQQHQVVATVTDSGGMPIAVDPPGWHSSDTAVAKVSFYTGMVTARGIGKSIISATVYGSLDAVTDQAVVFVVAGPAASVSVRTGASILLEGQSSVAVADPRDASNQPISDRSVTWASSAPAVVSVSEDGKLVAGSAGIATISASMEGHTGSFEVRVVAAGGPTVRGSLASADNDNRVVSDLQISVTYADGQVDFTTMPASGVFALPLSRPPANEVADIVIDIRPGGARQYTPLLRSAVAMDTSLTVNAVLIPLRWKHPSGFASGPSSPFSVDKAVGRRGEVAPYIAYYPRLTNRWPVAMNYRTLVGWPSEALPIPVVIVRDRLSMPLVAVSAADSIAFWRAMGEVELVLGDLFRPAQYSDVTRFQEETGASGGVEYRPVGFIAVTVQSVLAGTSAGFIDRAVNDPCPSHLLWCDANIGSMSFGPGRMSDSRVVFREVLHALGLGNTCSYASWVYVSPTPASGCDPGANGFLLNVGVSIPDVAAWEMMRSVFDLVRSRNANWSVIESVNGERKFILNKPPF